MRDEMRDFWAALSKEWGDDSLLTEHELREWLDDELIPALYRTKPHPSKGKTDVMNDFWDIVYDLDVKEPESELRAWLDELISSLYGRDLTKEVSIVTKRAKRGPILTPEGRLGNNSLYEKDSYKDPSTGAESTPKYKAELYLEQDNALNKLWDAIFECGVEGSGLSEEDLEAAIEQGWFSIPLKNGDTVKADREARGKNGDAMGGKEILRASTAFNANGDNAPGGVYVVDEDNKPIEWDRRSKVYNGCFMVLSVTFEYYKHGKNQGVVAYLNGAQYTRDGGERIGQDESALFAPVQRSGGGDGRTRGR